ncbi:hypothetical protein D770_06440 [Flammeovirgaceae bacterium 311]|nr:hypothetical protein D770_06440 [Flammeovirgaceae bacterium 311]
MGNFAKILLLMVVMLPSMQAEAQKEATPVTATNAVYLELLGNGVYYSINYERMFFQKGIIRAAARVGVGALPWRMGSGSYLKAAIPVELIGLLGKSKHFLEAGVGYTPFLVPWSGSVGSAIDDEFKSYIIRSRIPFRIGYRYQKPAGGFFFRAAYMPTLDYTPGWSSHLQLINVGVSVGKSF